MLLLARLYGVGEVVFLSGFVLFFLRECMLLALVEITFGRNVCFSYIVCC